MATIYVNSGAGGANDGTSWTDAYTSLASTTGAAAGDDVYVHNAHSQDPGASVTYNWSNGTSANPVRILCVDKDASDVLSTGATIAQTVAGRNILLAGHIYVDGMTFTSSDTLTVNSSGSYAVFSNCTFGIAVSTSGRNITTGTESFTRIENSTFNPTNNSGSSITTGARAWLQVVDSVINLHASATTGPSAASVATLELRSCDISGAITQFVTSATRSRTYVSRCRIGSYTNLTSTSPGLGSLVCIDECSNATVSGPTIGLIATATEKGTCTGSSSVYRTGGATRDAVNLSWSLVASSNAEERISGIATPDFSKKVEGGASRTITVYVAGGAEMYDDEVWLELEGPATTNTVQGYFYSSRVAYGTTRSALTSDASTWNGSGVGTVRKIVHTYTPDHDGLLVARVCYAKTSGAAIYVDPQIEVT